MKHLLLDVLLIASTALALLCALGVGVMKDAYQRIHFPASVVDLCVPLVVVAVWMDTTDLSARIKSVLVAILLYLMNAVLSHATAHAKRIRDIGHFELLPEDRDVERIS